MNFFNRRADVIVSIEQYDKALLLAQLMAAYNIARTASTYKDTFEKSESIEIKSMVFQLQNAALEFLAEQIDGLHTNTVKIPSLSQGRI